ncbi:sugar ABC transporter ATP-binding protein [Limobrevibacterium gyesilva]|uniref:Sugar ABC transporter ATP-binding protein n=1 Tax=Limobrevibacterium gyesilva TaxID=2991712 RepID=A0AA42CHR5_9PROT|nr:sugar ABC transporter ATP-binding protein [Limobrevibacterium gyesilva]MCW3475247.1 sugar ABC transporter ATP-binding protein [Limobrevibacterium gyesilva]
MSLAETTGTHGSGPPPDRLGAATPILELRGLDKRFPGTHALKQVDLAFLPGEVHAIVGENGAGKSTLIKLLTGVYPRTSGEIFWHGRPVALATPHDAIALGINAVHQEVILCRHLTVAANLFLGDETASLGILQTRRMERAAQAIIDDIGFRIPSGVLLGDLTIGQQQLVATARAATRGTKFLIFDEPTAYLTRQEADQLFALIRRLHRQGVTIVYISHRLEEIFELADRVSILRDGSLVSTARIADTDEPTIIRGMVNRSIEDVYHKEEIPFGPPVLETRGLTGRGFQDISLTVRTGEIVGLYGLIGAGRSEFVQALFGRHPKTGGSMILKGEAVTIRRESDAIARGIALVPESRRDQGLCLNLGVGFNLNLPIFRRLTRGLVISLPAQREHADRQIRDLRIQTASRNALAANLSGGNQQKLVVGKWLSHGADLYIFDEPTAGVDVGTKVEMYRVFAALLKRDAAIILISSYLPEVYELADRLHVFRAGRLVASHSHKDADHETILAEALGT